MANLNIGSKQGVSLRLSVTDRCDLHCRYCTPPEGSDLCPREELLSCEEIVELVTAIEQEVGMTKLRITGGEPLIRPDIERLISMLAELEIPDMALTTNGLHLPRTARRLKQAGLNRVNISLDALSPKTFRFITGGGNVKTAVAGIGAALDADLRPVKLNTVLIQGVNDKEINPLVRFAIDEGCELRFIELMPIGSGNDLFTDGFISSEETRQQLSKTFSITPLNHEPGTSARRCTAVDASGNSAVIGFISSYSTPFCNDCDRLRLTSDGRLVGCLARDAGISARETLRNGGPRKISDLVRTVMKNKRSGGAFSQKRTMASLGG